MTTLNGEDISVARFLSDHYFDHFLCRGRVAFNMYKQIDGRITSFFPCSCSNTPPLERWRWNNPCECPKPSDYSLKGGNAPPGISSSKIFDVKEVVQNFLKLQHPQPHHFEIQTNVIEKQNVPGFWYMFCKKEYGLAVWRSWVYHFCILNKDAPFLCLRYAPITTEVMLIAGHKDFMDLEVVRAVLHTCITANISACKSNPEVKVGWIYYKPFDFYVNMDECRTNKLNYFKKSYFYYTYADSYDYVFTAKGVDNIVGTFPQFSQMVLAVN